MGEGYLFLAEGFEEIEALTTVDLCRRAGIPLSTVAIGESMDVEGSHHIVVKADRLFGETDFSDAEMLVLPGGGKGTDNLEAHEPLMQLLKKSAVEGKRISAICAAPRILGRHGLLKGKKAVCYPGFEKDLEGAEVVQEPAVAAGNIITGRGMGCSIEFGLLIVEALAGKEKAEELKRKVVYPH